MYFFFVAQSAYMLASTLSNTIQNHSQVLWSKLYGLKVPPKVKHFLWRACKALPMRENFIKMKILVDALCSLCEEESKSTMHCLVKCKNIALVWYALSLRTINENIVCC